MFGWSVWLVVNSEGLERVGSPPTVSPEAHLFHPLWLPHMEE